MIKRYISLISTFVIVFILIVPSSVTAKAPNLDTIQEKATKAASERKQRQNALEVHEKKAAEVVLVPEVAPSDLKEKALTPAEVQTKPDKVIWQGFWGKIRVKRHQGQLFLSFG